MAAPLFPRSQTQILNRTTGRKANGAKIYFFDAGTSTPRAVYSDSALSTPHAHPIIADALGFAPTIFLQYGNYRLRIETSTGVLIEDTDNIELVAPPESGGGGGISVEATQIIQVGDIIVSGSSSARAGFVLLNGTSIGSAASGASQRANADTEDLFTFCWNTHSNSICAVSTGRGASPAADFAANKTLTLLDGRGRAFFGSDTMGSSAANVSQASTTITTTNLSTSATVVDITGVFVGSQIVSANIPAGTTVTNISGSVVTMSAQATATASGTAVRFSTFSDAEIAGSRGGADQHILNQSELSVELGTAVTTVINGGTVFRGGVNTAQSGSGSNAPSTIDNISATTTITNTLGGKPHNNVPPGIVVNYFQKL